jgi:hypothetical protein
MKNLQTLTIVVFCLLTYCACTPESRQMKRISADKSKAIVYLFDDVAVVRSRVKNAVVTLTNTYDGTFYELVVAHWLNKPTLSSETGDEIIRTLVVNVESLRYDAQRKVIYGIGVVTQSGTPDKLSEERATYFLFNGGKLTSFSDHVSFDTYLRNVGVAAGNLLDPKTLFSTD